MSLHFVAWGPKCNPCLMSTCVLKGARWDLKTPLREKSLMLRPRTHHDFNVALNEGALTRQITAQSAERRDVWSSSSANKWKERKTTQQHGQIRLSETIFKIWVKVQAMTSLYFTLTTALHPSFHPTHPLFVICSFSTPFHPIPDFTSPHVFISSPPSFLSYVMPCMCWLKHLLRQQLRHVHLQT